MENKKSDRDLLLAEISGSYYNLLLEHCADELCGMIGVSLYLIELADNLIESEEYTKAMEYEKSSPNKYAQRWDYFGKEHNTCLDWYFLDKAGEIIKKDYPQINEAIEKNETEKIINQLN